MIINKNNDHDHDMFMAPLPWVVDTYVKLAKYRVIFISENISDKVASELSALLLYFDNESHDELIEMYIHSNGGDITGLANIYDVMQMISAPIKTVCIGKCYSAAAVLLAAGFKGERYAFKNSSIMIHGIQAGFPIIGHDMTASKNYLEFLDENNDNVMKMLANHTGHTLKKVKDDCKNDVYMTAKEAKLYNIIDHIL